MSNNLVKTRMQLCTVSNNTTMVIDITTNSLTQSVSLTTNIHTTIDKHRQTIWILCRKIKAGFNKKAHNIIRL